MGVNQSQQESKHNKSQQGNIIFVCHGDTNFEKGVFCKQLDDFRVFGHMDNFAGVFTGNYPKKNVRVQITYGEEDETEDQNGNFIDFLGERKVMKTMNPQKDLVVVVDVTSIPDRPDLEFTFQQCRNPKVGEFISKTLQKSEFKYQIFQDCPDNIAFQDETDAFREITHNYCFMGLPVEGGDYNEGPVKCNLLHLEKASNAICELANAFSLEKPNFALEEEQKTEKWVQLEDGQELNQGKQYDFGCKLESLNVIDQDDQKYWERFQKSLTQCVDHQVFEFPSDGIQDFVKFQKTYTAQSEQLQKLYEGKLFFSSLVLVCTNKQLFQKLKENYQFEDDDDDDSDDSEKQNDNQKAQNTNSNDQDQDSDSQQEQDLDDIFDVDQNVKQLFVATDGSKQINMAIIVKQTDQALIEIIIVKQT